MRRIRHRGFEINFHPPDVAGGSLVMPAQALAATGGLRIPGTGAFTSAAEALAGTGNIQIPGTGAFTSAAEALAATGNVLPLGISGAALWLRADLGITQSGGIVSAWADQSGNGNNATQVTSGQNPTYNSANSNYNNQPTVAFSQASNSVLSLTSVLPAQPLTMIAVCDIVDAGAAQTDVCGDGATATRIFRSHSTTHWSIFAGTTLQSTNTTTTIQAFAGVFNNTSSALYINSSASAAASGAAGTNNPAAGPVIGAQKTTGGNNLNGNLAEFIVYNRALSQSEIGQLFTYLAARYSPGSWS